MNPNTIRFAFLESPSAGQKHQDPSFRDRYFSASEPTIGICCGVRAVSRQRLRDRVLQRHNACSVDSVRCER